MSDRVTFLRKTYAHLGGALIAFAILTGLIMKFATGLSWGFSKWALKGQWNWIGVIVLFMICGYIAERLARSESSRGLQYAGLGLEVAAWSMLLQPVLWMLMLRFSDYSAVEVALIKKGVMVPVLNGMAAEILWQSVLVTLVIFAGLTLTVFLTKKDFSFLRGILVIATFGALGVILASAIFGFSLGIIFCGFMILLMAGYILFQTSMVMRDFPPTAHVAAALMLFSTIATLFWYVLQLFMSARD